jgi:hypothetical protein
MRAGRWIDGGLRGRSGSGHPSENAPMHFKIADDSGFIDDGFVGSDWTWEDYFEREEREQHMLGWSTGMEHVWSIDVLF